MGNTCFPCVIPSTRSRSQCEYYRMLLVFLSTIDPFLVLFVVVVIRWYLATGSPPVTEDLGLPIQQSGTQEHGLPIT